MGGGKTETECVCICVCICVNIYNVYACSLNLCVGGWMYL